MAATQILCRVDLIFLGTRAVSAGGQAPTVDSGSCGGIVSEPLWLAAADLRAGRAVELLHEWRDVEFTTYFLRRDRRLTPQRVNRVIADTNMSSLAAAATPKAGHVQGCVRAARSVKRLSRFNQPNRRRSTVAMEPTTRTKANTWGMSASVRHGSGPAPRPCRQCELIELGRIA